MAPPGELTAESALEILSGRVALSPRATARLLGGGVSNIVALVEDGAQRIVLKQSLPRLRVRDRWLADLIRLTHTCMGVNREAAYSLLKAVFVTTSHASISICTASHARILISCCKKISP